MALKPRKVSSRSLSLTLQVFVVLGKGMRRLATAALRTPFIALSRSSAEAQILHLRSLSQKC